MEYISESLAEKLKDMYMYEHDEFRDFVDSITNKMGGEFRDIVTSKIAEEIVLELLAPPEGTYLSKPAELMCCKINEIIRHINKGE